MEDSGKMKEQPATLNSITWTLWNWDSRLKTTRKKSRRRDSSSKKIGKRNRKIKKKIKRNPCLSISETSQPEPSRLLGFLKVWLSLLSLPKKLKLGYSLKMWCALVGMGLSLTSLIRSSWEILELGSQSAWLRNVCSFCLNIWRREAPSVMSI